MCAFLGCTPGDVFPTRVGVNRARRYPPPAASSIPHACGGEPPDAAPPAPAPERIPHACGGEPKMGIAKVAVENVFPTRVGVNLVTAIHNRRVAAYSPRVWG